MYEGSALSAQSLSMPGLSSCLAIPNIIRFTTTSIQGHPLDFNSYALSTSITNSNETGPVVMEPSRTPAGSILMQDVESYREVCDALLLL